MQPPLSARAHRLASSLLALVTLVCFSTAHLAGQDVRYRELSKNLNIDRTPVAPANGLVASYAPALEIATPAVVRISSSKTLGSGRSTDPAEEMLRRMFPGLPIPDMPGGRQEGLGSGVIITPDGYILTNNHVVGEADEILVTMPETRREYPARLVGADPDTDVALIKIDANNLTPIVIGDSNNLRVGDVVLAVGNPFGLEQTVTHGIVSALGRRTLGITGNTGYENFIQTDASINKGNSGGALIDVQGRLVGVNTAIRTGGMSSGNVGIGFSIPSNMALNIVQRLLDGGGVVRRGFLGVTLREVDEKFASALGRTDLRGAIVRTVEDGTPASIAGLKAGDLIVEFDGAVVDDPAKLRLDISNRDPGTEVDFKIVRKGEERIVSVVLGDRDELLARVDGSTPPGRSPAPRGTEFLDGATIRDLDPNLRMALDLDNNVDGVFVDSVDEGTDAAESGLEAGQIITMVDQQNVSSVNEALQITERFDGQVLLLQIYKDGRRSILAVPMR